MGSGGSSFGRLARACLAVAAAGLAAGCFQPLYGERSIAPGVGVRDALRGVDVAPIRVPPNSTEAPLAAQIRNELLFSFTGGDAGGPPSHRLTIQLLGTSNTVAADGNTGFAQIENYTLRAAYSLTDLKTGAIVITGQTAAATGYDGAGQQRFARLTAGTDASRRAAKTISDQISTRLASYFVSGG